MSTWRDVLDLLACPACHQPLRTGPGADAPGTGEGVTLDCTGCGRRYPVVDDIPVLLVDEALEPGPATPGPATPA